MGCGTGGCSSGGCSTGGCNKLNTFDWLVDMDLPAYMQPFEIVEVRFKGTRKEFYRNVKNQHDITLNDYVVVEVENGYDIGKVSTKGEMVKLQMKKAGVPQDGDFPKIVRRASEADITKHKENLELEVPTMYKARSIAMELGLTMKLSDVEYRGDRRKATFFYTAEERVDFRELIKRLADSFKVRIEMRQIGYRQEAGRLGGIGSCGRELCCSTWLTDFKLVHTSAARYQNLSLNPLKLSGQCGKLKCCLNYELDGYMEAWKDFPGQDNLELELASGPYKVMKTDILKRMMWFAPKQEFGGEWLGLKVSEVKQYIEQNKQGIKPEVTVKKAEPVRKELDFKNDMGLDSLTRLDERKGNKKRGGGNRDRDRSQQRPQQKKNVSGNTPNTPKPNHTPNTPKPVNTADGESSNRNQGNNPNRNQGGGNNRNRNNRNRNNNNRPKKDNPPPDKPQS